MKKPSKIIGVVLARAGSKALPGKNIRHLGGKPLILHTIEAALGSTLLTHAVFSTDSEEMAGIGKQAGIDVPFIRPDELSTDTAHTGPVIEHAVNFIEERDRCRFDAAMTLQPTSPFRKSVHIDESIKKFQQEQCDCLISIKQNDYPPWWLFRCENKRIKMAIPYEKSVNVFDLERQQFPKLFRPNGAIYIINRDYLKKHKRAVNPDDSMYYIMDEKDSISIDTQLDFEVAELYWQKYHSS